MVALTSSPCAEIEGCVSAKNHAFAANEPTQSPGARPRPQSSNAASAIPAAGKTAVTLPGGVPTTKDSFAKAA